MSRSVQMNNKDLLIGTVVYAIGNIGTKILSFLIVPLYTYYISTYDMGRYDLLISTVSLISPLVSLKISDATYNWMIKKQEADSLCIKTTYLFLLKSIVFVTIILTIFNYMCHIEYFVYFLLLIILDSLLETTQKILRGFKNQKLFAFSGVFYTVILLLSNFISIVILKKGIESLMVNTIFSQFLTIIMIFIFEKRFWCGFYNTSKSNRKLLERKFLSFS